MPYVPKPQRARENWITLKEAMTHIQTMDNCDASSAWLQLQAALAEGAVLASWPMSEATQRRAGERTHHPIFSEADRENSWRSVRINLSRGTIVQQEEALQYEDGRHVDDDDDDDDGDVLPVKNVAREIEREIWVSKESIFKIWKEDTEEKDLNTEPPTNHEPTVPIVEHPTKAEDSRKASLEQVIDELRKFFKEREERKTPQPDVHALHGMLADRIGKPIAKKTFYMAFGRPEFEKYQRKAGQPKKN
jgi:hypothetical protein